METKIEILRETEDWLYGRKYSRENETEPFVLMPCSDFMQCKSTPWFANEPKRILEILGIHVDQLRAIELENLFDGWLGGFYYIEAVSNVSGDGVESVKWLMGLLAAHLNESGQSIRDVGKILPADYLGTFIKYLMTGKFPRSFAKDVFAALLKAERFVEHEDHLRRMTGEEIMDTLVADPKFQAADSSFIDELIEQVVAANAEQAAKVAEQPKLVQWFVGQVLKLAKGKAPAADVLEKLKTRFGV
jgi:Asp-tRNA(Asn)/Glu-tRNA(Gln) amidotransferase B subunit